MAGKVGMHRKLLNPARAEELRAKIKAAEIIKALEKHVIDGEEMSPSQVSAALGLLKKSIPDLAAVEVSGPNGGAVPHSVEFVVRTS